MRDIEFGAVSENFAKQSARKKQRTDPRIVLRLICFFSHCVLRGMSNVSPMVLTSGWKRSVTLPIAQNNARQSFSIKSISRKAALPQSPIPGGVCRTIAFSVRRANLRISVILLPRWWLGVYRDCSGLMLPAGAHIGRPEQ